MAELPRKEQLTGDVTAGEFKKGLNMFYDAVKEMKASSDSVDGKISQKVDASDVNAIKKRLSTAEEKLADCITEHQDISHLASKSELGAYESKSHASSTYATKSDVEGKLSEVNKKLESTGSKEWKVAWKNTPAKNFRTYYRSGQELCTLPKEWKECRALRLENVSNGPYVQIVDFIFKDEGADLEDFKEALIYEGISETAKAKQNFGKLKRGHCSQSGFGVTLSAKTPYGNFNGEIGRNLLPDKGSIFVNSQNVVVLPDVKDPNYKVSIHLIVWR